jgi:hypothetical protein
MWLSQVARPLIASDHQTVRPLAIMALLGLLALQVLSSVDATSGRTESPTTSSKANNGQRLTAGVYVILLAALVALAML